MLSAVGSLLLFLSSVGLLIVVLPLLMLSWLILSEKLLTVLLSCFASPSVRCSLFLLRSTLIWSNKKQSQIVFYDSVYYPTAEYTLPQSFFTPTQLHNVEKKHYSDYMHVVNTTVIHQEPSSVDPPILEEEEALPPSPPWRRSPRQT